MSIDLNHSALSHQSIYKCFVSGVRHIAREIEFPERGVDRSHRRDFILALTLWPLYIALSLEPLNPKEFASKIPCSKPHIIAPQKLNSHLSRLLILAFAVACDLGPGLIDAVLESEEFNRDFARCDVLIVFLKSLCQVTGYELSGIEL
jgi:hypothetical protein